MEMSTFISKLVSCDGTPAITPAAPTRPVTTSVSHYRTPAATSTTNFSPISEAGDDTAFEPEPLPALPPRVPGFATGTTAPKKHVRHIPCTSTYLKSRGICSFLQFIFHSFVMSPIFFFNLKIN